MLASSSSIQSAEYGRTRQDLARAEPTSAITFSHYRVQDDPVEDSGVHRVRHDPVHFVLNEKDRKSK